MASEIIHEELKVIAMSRKEAVDLIGLLAAQLGDVTLVGNQGGACPSFTVNDRGNTLYRMAFVLEQEENDYRNQSAE